MTSKVFSMNQKQNQRLLSLVCSASGHLALRLGRLVQLAAAHTASMPVSVWQASALLRLGHVFRIVCARVRVGSAGGVCLCGGLERHRALTR